MNVILFTNAFLEQLIVFGVFCVVAAIGVFAGIKIRKSKSSKNKEEV